MKCGCKPAQKLQTVAFQCLQFLLKGYQPVCAEHKHEHSSWSRGRVDNILLCMQKAQGSNIEQETG
jgi:hypothetical protein